MDFRGLAEAVQAIGLPGVLSLGLTIILYQQTGVLKQIRDSIDRLHDTIVDRKKGRVADAPARQAYPKVRPNDAVQTDRGTVRAGNG